MNDALSSDPSVLRVLVACEFSGVVRDAFRAMGHDAWSCDLLPAEGGGNYHIQGDVLRELQPRRWDLMIAHPPCTYLTKAGVRWMYVGGSAKGGAGMDAVRVSHMLAAASLFRALLAAPISRIAIENPIPHGYASDAIGKRYSQIFHPWQHGHGEVKATCLWLKGLPPLIPSKIVEGRDPRVHYAAPGPNRWKERSRTLTGIAVAMASQWGARPQPGENIEETRLQPGAEAA